MTATDLRTLRARLGLTQAQLAEALGVSVRAIENWEQGLRRIPMIAVKWLPHLTQEARP
jgi:DNA-binding transcriptional regulator YiaG